MPFSHDVTDLPLACTTATSKTRILRVAGILRASQVGACRRVRQVLVSWRIEEVSTFRVYLEPLKKSANSLACFPIFFG
jgi:hypothetical protein